MLIVILSGFVPFITRQWIFVILQLAGVVWVCLWLLLHIIKGKRWCMRFPFHPYLK